MVTNFCLKNMRFLYPNALFNEFLYDPELEFSLNDSFAKKLQLAL